MSLSTLEPNQAPELAGCVRFRRAPAVGQMIFLAAFPIWTALTMALIVAAIYALTVHGEAFGGRRA